jgi:hypothetical protein
MFFNLKMSFADKQFRKGIGATSQISFRNEVHIDCFATNLVNDLQF